MVKYGLGVHASSQLAPFGASWALQGLRLLTEPPSRKNRAHIKHSNCGLMTFFFLSGFGGGAGVVGAVDGRGWPWFCGEAVWLAWVQGSTTAGWARGASSIERPRTAVLFLEFVVKSSARRHLVQAHARRRELALAATITDFHSSIHHARASPSTIPSAPTRQP
ncbi:hypothetical protein BDZ45DRAFT_749306 [Acephala macrosclerotiorum]|nr:hypothetical protein BDZ45DRAFT_749306 [Acephala macrosclerotiorum]